MHIDIKELYLIMLGTTYLRVRASAPGEYYITHDYDSSRHVRTQPVTISPQISIRSPVSTNSIKVKRRKR